MIKQPLTPDHIDDRGAITDILSKTEFDAITLITFTKGAIRGNHFHEETVQWNYVVEGELTLATRQSNESQIVLTTLLPGDLAKTDIHEQHALRAEQDSTVLVITRGPRSGSDYESDTYRLDHPLL